MIEIKRFMDSISIPVVAVMNRGFIIHIDEFKRAGVKLVVDVNAPALLCNKGNESRSRYIEEDGSVDAMKELMIDGDEYWTC